MAAVSPSRPTRPLSTSLKTSRPKLLYWPATSSVAVMTHFALLFNFTTLIGPTNARLTVIKEQEFLAFLNTLPSSKALMLEGLFGLRIMWVLPRKETSVSSLEGNQRICRVVNPVCYKLQHPSSIYIVPSSCVARQHLSWGSALSYKTLTMRPIWESSCYSHSASQDKSYICYGVMMFELWFASRYLRIAGNRKPM